MNRKLHSYTWKELDLPRPFTLTSVHEALAHLCLMGPRGFVVLEARASEDGISYLLGTLPVYSGKIEELLRAHGDVQVRRADDKLRRPVTVAKHLTVTKSVLSLNADVAAAVIRQGLAAMFATPAGETAVVQVVLGKGFPPSPVPDKLQDPHESWLALALSGVKKASAESVKSAKEKAGQFNYQAIIRVGASGKSAASRVESIISAFRTLQSAGVSLRALPDTPEHLMEVYTPWTINLRLSVKELAPFLLLPAGEEEFPGVARIHPRRLTPPDWYEEPDKKTHDRSFALSAGALPRRLSISPKDSLEHTILVGPTGSGKSTAMEHLILADIHAGRSVLVLDPKADLVTDILERVPEKRHQDVVVIDPSDECPVGFNPLHFKGFNNKELVADAVLSVLREIFSDSWGIRTQQILSAALLTLCDIPGATLLWLPALLTDAEFRSRIVSRVKDRIGLLPFWHQFNAMKESERNTHIGPVLNKIEQFIFRPGLRAVLGQSEPRFNLMDLFYERKIVLVPLNRGMVGGESAKLLGSLIVGLAWTLALSRAKLPEKKRHIVSFYIDELQDYLRLPTDLADALAQARGLGVGMTLAHQYRGQLPPGILSAIDANARNKIVFGLNGSDARAMSLMSPELTYEDYMLLPRFSVYTNIMKDRRATGWIMGRTLPPAEPINLAAELKALSMKNYGQDAKATDEEFLHLVYPEEGPDTFTNNNNNDPPTHEQGIGRKKQ